MAYASQSTNVTATNFYAVLATSQISAPYVYTTGTVAGTTVSATFATFTSEVKGYLSNLGSTTPLVGTTAIGTATAVPSKGVSLITVASSSNPYLQLGAPTLGATVELYAIVTATSHAKTILASTDGSIKINSTCNAVVLSNSSDSVLLRGMSATQWYAQVMGSASLTTA